MNRPGADRSRLGALRVLEAVRIRQVTLNQALLEVRQDSSIDGSQALIAELSYGTCRYYSQLRTILSRLLDKPLPDRAQRVELILLLGLYQRMHTRLPPHAVVFETVELCRQVGEAWAGNLVNAILRAYDRKDSALVETIQASPKTRYSLPNWLWKSLVRDYAETSESIASALLTRAPMTLRAAPDFDLGAALQDAGISAFRLPELPCAWQLEQPIDVQQIPGFTSGRCSVQDAAAQMACEILHCRPGMRILDACAAPGGKSAALLERYPGIELTAVDISSERQSRTASTLTRLGLSARVVVGDAADPEAWGPGMAWDRILIDAPCTGTGVIRRHPDIKLLRSPGDVTRLNGIQQQLLRALWLKLRPDGYLLYATCSVLQQENDAIIGAFLPDFPDAQVVEIPSRGGTQWRKYGLQFLPQTNGHDGFYYALLHKSGRHAA